VGPRLAWWDFQLVTIAEGSEAKFHSRVDRLSTSSSDEKISNCFTVFTKSQDFPKTLETWRNSGA
jgi:hypothetical protein